MRGGAGAKGKEMKEIKGSGRGAVPSHPSPRDRAGLEANASARFRISSPGNAQERCGLAGERVRRINKPHRKDA